MNFDWSWLPWILLAALAFFAAGWLVARVDLKQLLNESRALPQSYFRGLNFLLNEQPDQAIEAFIEVTRSNPEAVELQFALGSLFRRRGEVDRAIRVHQSLSERSDISVEQRTNALLALALDYQKSGLLDHAERILADLAAKSVGTPAQQQQTLQLLLDIYVQENAWQKAIDAAKLLQSYQAVGRAGEGLAYLRELQHRHPAIDLLNVIFKATLDSAGAQAAYELVKDDLRANPTLVGLDRLLEAQVLAAPEERKADLVVLKDLVHTHSSRLAVYLCKQCGFKAKQFYWHCPACGGWETFPPRRTAEYDTADRHLVRSQVEG